MNGILPIDYLLNILSENPDKVRREVALQLIPGLDMESKMEIMEMLEEEING